MYVYIFKVVYAIFVLKFSEGFGMVSDNRRKNYSISKVDKLMSFILSIFSGIMTFLRDLREKCTIGLFEIRNKILRIEKESIGEEIKANIEKNILDLRKQHEIYITRKETYLIYHEGKSLIDNCKNCLNTCSPFKNRNKLLDEPSNDFIEKSMTELSHLLNEFEIYDNEGFIQERIQKYDYLFQKSPFPLDVYQKRAIIVDDKHNLVVAGAGSGKTEVLITRVAYLREREPDGINAKRILVLAFQNKAAKEISERLNKRFGIGDIEAKTFHSFGWKILKDGYKGSGKESPNFKFSDSNFEKEFSYHINSLFENKKVDGNFQKKITDYMKFYHDNEIIKSKDDFEEKEEFYRYMVSLKYTAFDSTKVKSEGERAILNFFISHNLNGESVKIRYERPANWMAYTNAKGEKQIPKPDFFFPDYDLYLEHWAIDNNGRVPEWFQGKNPSEEYRRGMMEKKEKFAQQDKYSLLEIAYHEFKRPDFEKLLVERMITALKAKYLEKEFEFTPIPYEKLIDKVSKECKEYVKRLPLNIGQFITIAKTYNQSPKDIEQRLETGKWSLKQKMFAYIALDIYEIYENGLRNENKIDFADMINLAVKELKENEGLYRNSFDQILIDEYQDISAQRYELIRELMRKNEGCKLFCVGDDWQSIMGFSGSDLDFFVNFHEYFDHPARTDLSINYRSCKSIVDTGAEIIKHNRGSQIEKDAYAKNTDEKPIKIYESSYDRKSPGLYHSQVAKHCVDSVKHYLDEGYEVKDILLLSRIGKNPMMQSRLMERAESINVPISFDSNRNPNKVPFMTVHKSKGLQAKVVFLLNVVEDLYGFPCEIENSDIFEPAILSRKRDRYEEERRLFYVAVTRSMSDLIIYTQKDSVSKFIYEIENRVTFCEL
ncbi:MAG: helicase [Euryarchaeota archaeon]|nr:helicase [Euryarchaeota archaeon]